MVSICRFRSESSSPLAGWGSAAGAGLAAGATGMLLHHLDATPEHGEGRFDFEVEAFATAIVASSKPVYEVNPRPTLRLSITPVVHLNDRVDADA